MTQYLFSTRTTMKPYNRKKYWIDGGYVQDMFLSAENVKEALKTYVSLVKSRFGVDISNTALKNKSPMYRDTANGTKKQTGYVLTGSTEMDDGDYSYSKQFIELWVEILTIADTKF